MTEESPTLFNIKIVANRKSKGLPVYNGGLGENPFPVPIELADQLKNNTWDKYYRPVEGLPELEQELKKKYSINNYTADSVMVGNGLKELLFIAQLSLPEEYTTILIAPFWVSYEEHLKILNKECHIYNTKYENDYKIDFEEFDEFLSKIEGKKFTIFNNPCNPTGTVYKEYEIESLAKILKKHDVVIFEDQIYIELTHKDFSTCSLSKFCPENVLIGSSISKQFACGGYRLGWLVFPEQLKWLNKIMHKNGSSIYSCAPAPMHHVGIKAVKGSDYLNKYIESSIDIFSKIGKECFDILTNQTKIKCSVPMGAWYLFIDLGEYTEELVKGGIETDVELCKSLTNDIGFVTVPGSVFGSDHQFCLRYAYIDIDVPEMDYSRILEGLTKFVEWIKNISN